MDEQEWTPMIYYAAVSKSPVIVGEAVTITVKALDVFRGEQADTWYSGEPRSGEA